MSLPVEKALRKAQSHIKAGELAEAIDLYKQVLSKFPKNKQAIQGYQKLKAGITSKDSSSSEPPEKQVDELLALYKQGRFEEVLAKVKPLISLFSMPTVLYNIQGASNTALKSYEAAIESYRQAIKINPNYLEAYFNLGIALEGKGDLDAALDSYKQAIKIKPDCFEAYVNIGIILRDGGDLEAAIESYEKAINIKPDKAVIYYDMGNAQKDKGDLDAAIDSFKKAIKIIPDYAQAHFNLGLALLNKGRITEGLDEFEWRWKVAKFPSKKRLFSIPMWNGTEPLQGKKILFWGEQGPQDMIIWSSYLRHLPSQAKNCILECPEKLVSLFARSFPNIEVRAENRHLDTGLGDIDFQLPMGSLLRHCTPENLKGTKPDAFLAPDPSRVNFWKNCLSLVGEGPFIGISWKSPVVTPERMPNYAQISDLAPVFLLPDVTFINLQSTDFTDDLAAVQNEFGINVHNFDDLDHYNDLDDVAALCAALDVVVSVSTAVSAIAAGVGTSTKLVAWRQSSWSNLLLAPRGPSVDTFERNTWEPWDTVFQSVAKDIADFRVASFST